jgi:hypothetical protein
MLTVSVTDGSGVAAGRGVHAESAKRSSTRPNRAIDPLRHCTTGGLG